MRRILILISLCLASAPAAMACPPDVVPDDGGGSFSFGGYGVGAGFGAGGCGGGFGAGSCGAPVASFAAPAYGYRASFAAPVYAAPVVRRRVFAAPAYGYGGFGGGFRGGFRGGYGGVGVVAPVRVHYAAPVMAAPVYGYGASPVVAVPVRAPGPVRGAFQGFFGGVRNRLNGF
jgi:hypothetical protein